MIVDVGPVAPASAVAWMAWADATFGELRKRHPGSTVSLIGGLDDIEHYFRHWLPRTCILNEAFRWHAEVDPDELEYLFHALFNLDARLVAEVHRGERQDVPDEGRMFYLVLVRALLHALETESPGRAAFVDQLRSSWPVAAEAS